jgi:hypothetical protein
MSASSSNDPVLQLRPVRLVDDVDSGAEHHAARRRQAGHVDDLRVRQLGLDIANPRFHQALLFLGRVILGVFLEVAVRPRGRDRFDHFRSFDGLELLELLAQQLGAAGRERDLRHHPTSACRSCSRFTARSSR